MNFLDVLSQAIFGWFCHQNPEFLLQKEGLWVWLCPRCMGLHLGFLLTLAGVFALTYRIHFTASRRLVWLAASGLLLLLADWLAGQWGIWAPTGTSRLLTGLAGGSAFALLAYFYWKHPATASPGRGSLFWLAPLYLFPLIAGSLWVAQASWAALTLSLLIVFAINVLFIISLSLRKFWFHPKHTMS